MKPKKIAFLGLFGQQNLGNECTLQAMIHHTRKRAPEADLLCICTGPDDTRSRHGIPAFEMYAPPSPKASRKNGSSESLIRRTAGRAWREFHHGLKAFRVLRGTGLLIVPGTGLLVDHTTGFQGYPYYLFKWALIAKLRRCKVLVLSVGAGPIVHPLSKLLIKGALRLADHRSYRDTFSKEYLEGIGFSTKGDPICPDLAFSLPEGMFPESRRTDTAQTIVGVGLIDYYGQGNKFGKKGDEVYKDYIDKTGALISWLLDHHYRVRLLLGDMEYDMKAIRDVMNYLQHHKDMREDGQVISEPIDSVAELLARLAGTDIVISPRYHNVILSLMLKKRAISLSYNEKFEALMHGFELDTYCLRLDELDVNRLIEQLISIEREGDRLSASIGKRADEYRRALNDQYETVFAKWGR